jgi:hypothetical protein
MRTGGSRRVELCRSDLGLHIWCWLFRLPVPWHQTVLRFQVPLIEPDVPVKASSSRTEAPSSDSISHTVLLGSSGVAAESGLAPTSDTSIGRDITNHLFPFPYASAKANGLADSSRGNSPRCTIGSQCPGQSASPKFDPSSSYRRGTDIIAVAVNREALARFGKVNR